MYLYHILFLLRILSLPNPLEIQEIALMKLLNQVKTRLETEAPAPSISTY